MSPFWFLRLRRFFDHPPSKSRVLLVLAVVAISLSLYGIEHLWGWPDWLTVNRVPRGRLPRF